MLFTVNILKLCNFNLNNDSNSGLASISSSKVDVRNFLVNEIPADILVIFINSIYTIVQFIECPVSREFDNHIKDV